jgi:LysR family glycine cleavage system transcriptional activator/LysR family D-serine deaminase transcriptional activator
MTKSYTKERYPRLPSQQAIRVFEAAARHLSFSEAALELSITQSGVSKQIKNLESFLGISLFIRKGQRIQLTNAGKQFQSRASQALDYLQQAVDEIQGAASQLRLQVPPTFAARWLIPRLEKLKLDLPQLDLHIETTWLRTIRDKVQAQSNELVIHACIDYPYDNLHSELLRKEALFVMVSPDYIARYGSIEQPEDLVGKTLIHTRLDGHIHWEVWTDAIGLTALDTNVGYEFETLDMALSAAENGIGVLVCDLFYAMQSLENNRLIIPFDVPKVMGLSYLLLSDPLCNYQRAQSQYRDWLQVQIDEENRQMDLLQLKLGLDPLQSLDEM